MFIYQHILIRIFGVDNHKVFNLVYYQLFVDKVSKANKIST